MKLSYNWLIELTGVDWSPEEVGDRLTLCGTACEEIEHTARYMDKVVVGHVVALNPIEGADKIRLATVNVGSEQMDLVCGAPNVAEGQKVPVALLGAKLAGDIVIKKVKIRGVESCGMICSQRELGISDDHAGIMVLDEKATLGQPIAEHLDYDDYILTFELTPNRADSMSAIGLARDLAALAGVKVKRPKVKLVEIQEKAADVVSVSIEDAEACPRYAARVIRNLKISPSPWWIQKKLLASGIRPISNVVDITNLVMLECGHPLHAFDLDRFGSDKVVVRPAKKDEKFTTLDGVEHKLIPDVLMITNGKEGVASGGVMGGLFSEVKESTTKVMLEAAYFDPSMIRRSRRHLGFVTESSQRFEKGADPNGIEYALDRAAALMHELCGGEVLAGIVDCYPKKIEPQKVTLRPERCNAVLGTDITSDRMVEILRSLDFEVKNENPIVAFVPTFRLDVEREIDLIEEVVRIEGYDSVTDAVTNVGPLFTPLKDDDLFVDDIKRILTGAGFDETIGHGFADRPMSELLNPDQPLLSVTNPVSEDLNVMRNNLVHTVLNVIKNNISHRNLNLQLFELGRVYFPPDKSDNWIEEDHLLIAVTGQCSSDWRSTPRNWDFYDVKGGIDALAQHFAWPEFKLEAAEVGYLEEGQSYNLTFKGEVVGTIGQIKVAAASRFEVKQPVYVAELSVPVLRRLPVPARSFKPLPIFPAAPRDLAILVDKSVAAGDISARISQAAGELAESVEIFDVFSGKQVPAGKKSIAVSICYRSTTGSLSGNEVDARQKLVVEMLKKAFKAEIRDK